MLPWRQLLDSAPLGGLCTSPPVGLGGWGFGARGRLAFALGRGLAGGLLRRGGVGALAALGIGGGSEGMLAGGGGG